MSDKSKKKLSRRRFVTLTGGALAAGGLLAACGDNTVTTAPTTAAATTAASTTAAATTAAATTAAAKTTAAATTAAGTTAAATTAASTTAAATGGQNLAVSKSGFKGTLQYWVLGYQPNGGNNTGLLMDAAVAAFTKANPDIKVEITGYTGDQAGFTKLTQAVQGGQSVDMFRLPSDILPLLVKDGLVAPIDEFLTAEDKADIFPSLLDAVRGSDGKAYSWPLWVPPVGMYLNLDIFKEKGVDPPKSGWTYDQFVDIAKKLTFTRANGEKVYGYSVGIDPGLVNSWPFIIGDGALPLSKDNTKYTWNTPEGISGMKKLADLALVHKVTPPDFGSQSVDDLATAFKDKKVLAMYSEPSGASSGYKTAKLNFDVIDMPIGASGKPMTAGGIGLISVAAIKDKTKLTAAMDLGRYLTSAQVQKDVAPNDKITSGFYLAPGARKSVQVVDPISKFSPLVDHCYITPIIAEWPQIRTILHPNIQNAVFGKISAEQAMNNPAKEINDILAQRK
jgi:multiple sugar transport system substrate-binding protein